MLKKRLNLKSTLLLGILLTALFAGVGLAYAITIHEKVAYLYPSVVLVQESKIQVTDYVIEFSEDLLNVKTVAIVVKNTEEVGGPSHNATIDVVVISDLVEYPGLQGSVINLVADASVNVVIAFETLVPVEGLTQINVMVTQIL